MDVGLIIILLLALFTIVVLLPIAIGKVSKSKSWKEIAIGHLVLFLVYFLFFLTSEDNGGSLIPLPEKPIKIGLCVFAHIWLAFFHAALIGKDATIDQKASTPAVAINFSTESGKKYKIATLSRIIIVLSSAISINPFWAVFGLPLYLLGTILLIKNESDKISRVKWSVIPICLVILIYLTAVVINL